MSRSRCLLDSGCAPTAWHETCNTRRCTGYGWNMGRWQYLSIGLMGCSDYGVSLDTVPPGFDTTSATADSGADTDTVEPIPKAEYYSVHLSAEVSLGELLEPQLQIDLYTTDIDLACTHSVAVTATASEALPPGEPILTWWRLDLEEGVSEDPCPQWPARTWWVGFGAYDARLDPGMASADILGYDVYGLYLRESSSGLIYVIGTGGTSDMYEGVPDLTVAAPPLPDGQYRGTSLILMDL